MSSGCGTHHLGLMGRNLTRRGGQLPSVRIDGGKGGEASERTARRRLAVRGRRVAFAGLASVLVVAGVVAAALTLTGGDRSADVPRIPDTGGDARPLPAPGGAAAVPRRVDPHECDAEQGAVTDIENEPAWRPFANYLPWTDGEGCLLRIDILAERTGPEHCGYEDARVIIAGRPLGNRYTTSADAVEFARDPDGVFGRPELTAGFDPDAELPDDAVDSGYRRHQLQLWHIPGDQSAIWIVSPDGVERWPAGTTPGCL